MTARTAEPRPEFRPDIEGLRGVAILLVVAYHAGTPLFTGGYVGVDVFFVLSGYLITWLLIKEAAASGRIDLIRFYARRGRRLLPAVTVMLAGSIAAGYLLLAPLEQERNVIAALATAIYASNLYFAAYSLDYMGPEADSYPLLHTWSLAVEEQFYLLWPLLILLVLSARGGAGRVNRRALGVAFLLVIAGSLGLAVYLTEVRQPWAFFLPVTRAWEFAAGGLALLLTTRDAGAPRNGALRHASSLAGWFGLALIVISGVAFDDRTPFPGAWALLPVIGTALVLVGSDRDARPVAALLRWAPLRWIGRVSYSWYLWHWPVLVFGEVILGDPGHAQALTCLAVSLVLATLSYRLVEQPVRRHAVLIARPGAAVVMSVLLSAGGAGAAAAWGLAAANAVANPSQRPFVIAASDTPSGLPRRCLSGFFDVEVPRCSLGVPDSGATLVLFGDSHAAQWFPAIDEIARSQSLAIAPLIKQACPAADVDLFYPRLGRMYHECPAWREAAFGRVNDLRPVLTVVSSSYAYAGFMQAVAPADWEAGMRRTFSRLAAASGRVLFIRDTPRPGFDVPECLSRAAWQPGWLNPRPCSFRAGIDSQRVFERERAAATGFGNVEILDLTERFCPGGTCPPILDGVVAYRDSNHIAATVARRLAPDLSAGSPR